MDHSSESECTYQIGERSLRVGTSSIATSSTSALNRTLVVPDEQRVIIKPNLKGRLVGLFFLALFTGFIVIAVIAILNWPRAPAWQFWLAAAAWSLGILLGVVAWLVCLSFVLSSNRFRFDQASGEFSHGPIWSRRRRPLSSIVAVQLLRGQAGKPDRRSAGLHWPTYELNLVLDDAAAGRLNMSCHGDLAWSHDTGRKLADFLGVPLLDAVQETTGEQPVVQKADSAGATVATGAGAVETTPLVAGAASFTSRKLVWESATCPVLKPNLPMRLFGGLMALGGGAVFAGIWANVGQVARNAPGIWMVLLVGGVVPLVFVLAGLTLYVGRRVRFDGEEGEMSVRTLWSGWRRPLGDIRAIQLISGGYHRFESPDAYSSTAHKTYQLNLVWSDAAKTRFNLANQIDLKWSRQAGHQLARFLKVPFLVHAEEATAKSGGLRQPVLTELGSSSLAVDAGPLHEKDHLGLRYASRLGSVDHDCLVVRHAVSGCAGLALLVGVVPVALLSVLLWATDAPADVYGICVSFAAAPFLLLAALIYFGYHRFDKSTGIMTYGWGFVSITRLLSDIMALQLIPGAASKGQKTYELNLILEDPYEPRLQLARSADQDATRQMGRQIAEFLGVRLTERMN